MIMTKETFAIFTNSLVLFCQPETIQLIDTENLWNLYVDIESKCFPLSLTLKI